MALEGGSMLGDADGMGDILSLALEQSGFGLDPFVPTTFPPTADMTPMSGPLLSNDINAFTDSLFSGFTPVPTSTVINPSYMPSSGPEMAFFLQPNIPQPQLNFGQPQGPSTTDDLATLLETTSADYLQSISDDFQSLPPPQSIPHVSPMVPPHSLPLTHPPIHSDPLSSLGPMDVDDVLLELGLDDPTFSSISQPPPAPPPQITSSPFPMRSVTRMIGSVSVTPLNNGGKLHIHVNNGQRLTTPKAQVANTLPPPPQPQADEELEDEDDQFVAADTYATYKPAKLNTGYSHPDPIVESSSLASVEPPQVWFDLKFPEMVIEEVRLSSLQLEAVVYSCQQHMNLLADGSRAGFLIGDGAGVGKGRTVAGIIYQNYIEGRKKALWLSVSNDLKYDAIRDLHDVGAKKINVYALNKFHYGKISGKRNGRVKKGVIFATYSSLIGESSSGGKYRTRFNQLFHWLGPHFDGVIVFDECHKAKNLVPSGAGKPSKTGITVLQLQKKLPKARIVYCSATGASEPKNMAYMSRLGIWGLGTQFGTFQDFIKSVERRGVGAMELVAMDMKLRGLYIARQLSFTGVTFSVEEISLSPEFITMYDKSVAFWVEARRLFKEAADLLDYDSKGLKTVWGQFWAAHQRFFKYLCIAAKVPSTIELAKKALKDGKCVVIGLQSTGEARTLEQLGQNQGELDGFVSTAKGVLESLIKRHFPTPSVGGINWDIFNNDPTLPQSCRKRKRGQVGLGEFPSSEESSSGWENSDSAVESSDDDEEEMKEGDEEDSDDSESDSSGDKKDFSGLFGPDEPNWLEKSKPKTKKRKISPSSRGRGRHQRGNYSIKPPITSASNGQAGELKFNYKTLEFERVTNPRPNKPIERRQSMPVTNGHKSFDRQLSQQPGSSQSLLEVMSSSALTTGSQSGLRHVTVHKMKDELFRKLEELAPLLPTNSLDQLIDGLGGPTKVSEMTGRRGRIVTMSDGSVRYQLRTEADVSIEMLNITEKQRFMDGDKNVAIISEAASSGISLQADRRAKNQKRRVHITLELPWSADKAIQQFGRTHRSNQINAPEYVFLISTLSGEHRFASIVAKRLESLGALTHGDRRATESRDLSRYNIDTKYGRQALEVSMRSLVGLNTPIISSPKYSQEFIDNARVAMTNVDLLSYDRAGQRTVDKESLNMSRFLNRLLGLPVELQNLVFSYFTDTLEEIIRRAKRAGRWDGGILDFGASGEHVELVESKEYVGDAAFGTATTQLHKVLVERGISFTEALNKLNTDYLPGEGFYISNKPRNDKHLAVMLKISKEGSDAYLVHRPNTGVQARPEELKSLKKKYTMSTPEEAEKWWTLQYDTTLGSCNHSYWQGKCRLSTPSHPCDIGIRRKTYYILTGSLLGVWTHLEGIFIRHPSHAHKMQIVRVHTPGRKLVGILIPAVCVVDLNTTLEKIALQAAGSADNAIDVS